MAFAQKEGTPDRTPGDLMSPAALVGGAGVDALAYGTGFEEFTIGDIDLQNGWSGQWANWQIVNTNPYAGAQNLESVSDGFGQTLAFSPEVGIGTEDLNFTSFMVAINGSGVTWQFIPQSPTDALVCTRLQIDPTGAMSAMIDDGLGGAVMQSFPATLSSGYHQVIIESSRTTKMFRVLIDGSEVFSGLGFSGNQEQFVLLSLMEVTGSTMLMDELVINDGAFLTVPTMGTWGMIALCGIMCAMAIVFIRRRN